MTINGRPIVVAENCSLLYLLREQLNLTSVKNGCSEGACGACMVLVEGQARRACLLTVAKLAGKQVVTVEGLSDREKQVYAYAFSAVGAVQCGFCTPGMVISAKALLDQNPHPDMAAVRRSIRPNLCRCTGYKKIEQAILLAARLLRDSTPLPILSEEARLDAAAKVLGQAEYSDDLRLPGLLHGSALRSPYPHGRLMGLELTAARALPGVKAVLSASDVPGQLCIGHLRKDYPVLIPVGGEIRFLGDAIAVVAAESREIAEQAKALIRADYQILPGIFSPAESMAKDAPQLSGEGNLLAETRLRRGDAAAAIAQAPFAVCNTYHLPMTEQAFLEPETAVAVRQGQQLWIYSGDQDIYQTRRECSEMLGLPGEQVRVIAKTVGGAFGGKEDMSVQHHAALLAWYTKQPVKVSLTRDESLQIHPKRHAMEITVTTACEADGLLTAVQMEILADAGAYASLSGPVLQRACTHGAGPYRCANIDIHGCAWLTNNPPGGAFRGFGVSQSCFAGEANLNLLAAQVGISPWEIRAKNGIRPGDLLPNGQIAAADTAYLETLAAVKPFYLSHPGAGIASAVKNSGLGVGVADTGRCRLEVQQGQVLICCSAACVGQGIGAILCQIVAEITGLPRERLVPVGPDTARTPHSGNTTASRQTLFSGEAARRAAAALRQALDQAGSLAALEQQQFCGEYTGYTDPFGTGEKEHPVSHIAYSYATQVAVLDDQGRVAKILAAHDVGRPLNPLNVSGQIEGGVTMSLGYALRERFPLREGRPQVKMAGLGLFRAEDTPEIETVLVKNPRVSPLALGAKGVGEIAAIPAAPAVQNAYYHYDGVFRCRLPLENTPYQKNGRDKG